MKKTLLDCGRVGAAVLVAWCASSACAAETSAVSRVWTRYRELAGKEADCLDMRRHGVDAVEFGCRNARECREMIKALRSAGLKLGTGICDITESVSAVEGAGLEPHFALMIGGAYKGKAIDRHLFSFTAERHSIVIEPPVNDAGFPYGNRRIGHYYPSTSPVRAEAVVPLRLFDGRQHLAVVPVELKEATGAELEVDTVAPGAGRETDEYRRRLLWRLTFDLTPYRSGMLDKVGLAVYWKMDKPKGKEYAGFKDGMVSAAAESTREALRRETDRRMAMWAEGNGGEFPAELIAYFRFGDESFHRTGSAEGSPAASYPLWDFSEAGIAAYRALAPKGVDYPRTWGFPEIYGAEAYGWWQYAYHRSCAELVKVLRRRLDAYAPAAPLLRNTTRSPVFWLSNDHDGTGQELLARAFDVIHLDPYPMHATYDESRIPMDMAYCSGLARRFAKPLVPWMQAHQYSQLGHVTPDVVRRMFDQHFEQGIDGVCWLGYGNKPYTFPAANPASWEAAAEMHARLHKAVPSKPKAQLAVLRPYSVWALSHAFETDKIRNPADWMLRQFLLAWSVDRRLAYDVFELPPKQSEAERAALAAEMAKYRFVVSTVPYPRAKLIGRGTEGTTVGIEEAAQYRAQYLLDIDEMLKRRP